MDKSEMVLILIAFKELLNNLNYEKLAMSGELVVLIAVCIVAIVSAVIFQNAKKDTGS